MPDGEATSQHYYPAVGSLFSVSASFQYLPQDFSTAPYHTELDYPITTEEVQYALLRMKNGKSRFGCSSSIKIYDLRNDLTQVANDIA